MRKIVAGLFMSLDGVVESPHRWVFPYFNDEVAQVVESNMAASDAVLLGRRTYEEWAAYWPDKTGEDDPFADYINETTKFVVSTTLKSVEWRNSALVTGDVTQQLAELKQRLGKNIAISGSATLVRSLLREGLLDELGLLLYRIVVGTGQRLFEGSADRMPLELVDSRAFSTGVVSLTYRPA